MVVVKALYVANTYTANELQNALHSTKAHESTDIRYKVD